MAIAPTPAATRPEAVRSIVRWTSSHVNVPLPGATGSNVSPDSSCAQSPLSLRRWLTSWTTTRPRGPARARTARWLASVPDGMKTAASLPRREANELSSIATAPPREYSSISMGFAAVSRARRVAYSLAR